MEENMNSIEGAPICEQPPESRVARFRRLIEQGEYKVNATRLAERMLDSGVVEAGGTVH
jgi:anti-sigma28 factor (negative regulator of flagellin synthesis)